MVRRRSSSIKRRLSRKRTSRRASRRASRRSRKSSPARGGTRRGTTAIRRSRQKSMARKAAARRRYSQMLLRASRNRKQYWGRKRREKTQRGFPGCRRQTTSKYTSRPSPAFPANECCGMKKLGNDGYMWISKPNAFGVCAWKR